jgi:phosphoglycerate dehydrogenase-like enzyme
MTSPLRILLSPSTRERIGPALAAMLHDRPHELVTIDACGGPQPIDADIAFISRDVTGLSTKHVLTDALPAFYAALRESTRLKWVHGHSAGADRPIFAELKARGVAVTLSPGANAEVVAQTAIAGLLALARQFPRLWAAQKEHRWESLIGGALPRDLAGQTALIVGWGAVGQRLGTLLRALAMDIVVARHTPAIAAPGVETVTYDALATMLPRANWLILACPLSDRTRDLIDRRAFAALPRGAHLVNVARGEIVVEPDLIEALRSDVLAGAYLDVFAREPLDGASPLWDLDNVIVTPHSAGHSDGNTARVDGIFLAHLHTYLEQRKVHETDRPAD